MLSSGPSFVKIDRDKVSIFSYDTELCELEVKVEMPNKRIRGLKDNEYTERIIVANPSERSAKINPQIIIKPKFRDIFEVRGIATPLKRKIEVSERRYTYRGVDGFERWFKLSMEGDAEVRPKSFGEVKVRVTFETNLPIKMRKYKPKIKGRGLNGLLEKAITHISMLSVQVDGNPILLAGIPDYYCIFGRDSIISSLFLLPYAPEYAKGTLKVLARLQGKDVNEKTLEEPGKIPHEFRLGELSLSGKMPFSPYYGSIDATPLYIILAWEYFKATGNEKLIREIKCAILGAYEWILAKLKEDFVQYEYANPFKPMNQGWKDSKEGVPGAKPPIALVEVQGYAYGALMGVYNLLGIGEAREKAKKLKRRFKREFKGKKGYKLTPDSDVLASNQGHLLLTGIADDTDSVVKGLFSRELMTRWGIRTLGENEEAYDPFSYHNGSIWPHDNAIIALGLSRAGEKERADEIGKRVMDALCSLNKIPELYAGLDSPVPFEVERANEPQAWAAAAIFAFITVAVENGKTSLPDLKLKSRVNVEVKDGEVKVKTP
ncbi:glycogen debranching protein [Thermococcus chitonophagus]|uniref:Glycogen debranching enzyme n=1 Tax=Thermococcus chitonophagus TaxID=54262 RepID=A0A160VU99_9EURY|nr:glycogen debranching N-terminal domain-containing protein [Thermococcus chitonophagus]ASJ16916.1 glycogen debranching protein [Thermococcus chitonophagus]CUX78399.1 Glycogen debranching enzyme [Thermococcus chitonophagus]